LAGIDVVGDDGDLVGIGEAAAEALKQGGLAGADRAADADANGKAHDLNNLVSWVSCFMLHQSTIRDAAPRVSNGAARRHSTWCAITGSSEASAATPSLWPIGARRKAAETRLPQKAVR